jgi:hypothetical protein
MFPEIRIVYTEYPWRKKMLEIFHMIKHGVEVFALVFFVCHAAAFWKGRSR